MIASASRLAAAVASTGVARPSVVAVAGPEQLAVARLRAGSTANKAAE